MSSRSTWAARRPTSRSSAAARGRFRPSVRSPAIRSRCRASTSSRSAPAADRSRASTPPASCGSARKARAQQPGPACYGRGGKTPTVTDANVVLGHLDPDSFFGGRMRLDRVRRGSRDRPAGARARCRSHGGGGRCLSPGQLAHGGGHPPRHRAARRRSFGLRAALVRRRSRRARRRDRAAARPEARRRAAARLGAFRLGHARHLAAPRAGAHPCRRRAWPDARSLRAAVCRHGGRGPVAHGAIRRPDRDPAPRRHALRRADLRDRCARSTASISPATT